MLNFTTTTVINSLEDTSGKPLIEKNGGVIHIKRHNPFVESKIVSVVRTNHVDPVCASVTVPGLTTSYSADTRIELYIRSVGNADPMFANSLLHKGKPLFIEIPAGTSAADLNKVVNKYNNLMFGGDNQIHSEVNESEELVLTCANPYQTITKATLSIRNSDGNFEHLNNLSVKKNDEGFGDYDHIMKDLRLPTSANLRWKRTMEDEMPIKGASYDQFILTYRVDRGVMGLGVVGATATSETTHVFWVNSAVANEFADKFSALDIETKEEYDIND